MFLFPFTDSWLGRTFPSPPQKPKANISVSQSSSIKLNPNILQEVAEHLVINTPLGELPKVYLVDRYYSHISYDHYRLFISRFEKQLSEGGILLPEIVCTLTGPTHENFHPLKLFLKA